jgi:hypothetical protein
MISAPYLTKLASHASRVASADPVVLRRFGAFQQTVALFQNPLIVGKYSGKSRPDLNNQFVDEVSAIRRVHV